MLPPHTQHRSPSDCSNDRENIFEGLLSVFNYSALMEVVDSFFCSLTPKTTIFGSYRVRICYHSLKTFKSKHFFDHLPQIPIGVKVGLGVGGRVGVGKATSKCCF